MPLINTSVPNLIQGVSQQPDASRFAGQCDEQENALSSVAEGLKKRPNTRHVARLLGQAISSNSFVHFINRDSNEKYVLIHDGTNLRAFNLETGDEASIDGNANGLLVSSAHSGYLNLKDPKNNIKALTIADSTFMVNTSKVTAMDQQTTSPYPKEALVLINQGDYKKDYAIKVTLPVPDSSYVTADATLTFNMTRSYTTTSRYVVDHDGPNFYVYDRHYKHHLQSVNVTDGGSGYLTGVALNIASNLNIYSNPSFTIYRDETDGSITSISVTNSGEFEGTGYADGHDLSSKPLSAFQDDDTIYYDYFPPTLSYTFNQGTATGVKDIIAKYTSLEGSSSSVAERANTNYIAAGLVTSCNVAGQSINQHTTTTASDKITTYFDVSQHGNLIKLVLKNNVSYDDFTVTTIDSLSDTGMTPIYKEVSSISDLPAKCINGFKVKIIGDAELNQDDYYVEFVGTGNAGSGDILNGSWVETTAPSITTEIAENTRPIEIINTSLNTFETRLLNLAPRTVGSLEGNPNPSFIGNSISNLFFFKNRLGFLSNESIVFSEVGFGGVDESGNQNFNFFRTTTTSLLDSDPIDVGVTSSRVTNLKAAKGFQENLVLFSNNGQFVLKGGDVLTPKTVSITPVTNFTFEEQVDPLPIGSYIYFPFTRGAYTGLREFTLNATTDTYDSVEVTEHIPAYIPKNIVDIAGTTTEETIALLSEDEPTALYLYNYFWNNNQKVLSAWSKFTFDENIRGIEFVESTLYMVVTDDEENTHLVSLPFESGLKDVDYDGSPSDFLTLLDKRVRAKITSGSNVVEFEQSDSSYSGANADHPYTFFNGTIPSGGQALSEVFVDSNGVTHSLKYQNVGAGGQVLLTDGNASATLYGYVGVPYTMKYKFSTQVFKAQTQKGASPTASSSMQVRNGSLFFDDTHTFDVKVTPENRPTATTTFSADDVPEAEQLGAIKFAEGNFRFPVYSKAKHADIVIENDSPFDSKFSSAEFESFVHPRSSRYG